MKADDKTQKRLEELAAMSLIEYDQSRKKAAEELGIRTSVLDATVRQRRVELSDIEPEPLFPHWEVEPWPKPVDGDDLLAAIIRRTRSHVIVDRDQAIAVALWVMVTWAHDAATHSPILLMTSAEANSGKSTLTFIISFIVRRGMVCAQISEAALYRGIEIWLPTILVDDADTLLAENEPLKTVINTGHTRGSGVPRCIGEDKVPHLFPTFCPKTLNMKGRRLPDTTLSRCVTIEMQRKRRVERTEHFTNLDDPELAELRRRCLRWTEDHIERLKVARPNMPEGFDNRLGDNWRLMLAIADEIGGHWPEGARDAAVALSAAVDTASIGTQALSDIRRVFKDKYGSDRIASSALVAALRGMQDRPWPEFKHGRSLSAVQLARLLKPFGVAPIFTRNPGKKDEKPFRGYRRADFEDAWERYLEPDFGSDE
jgi:putative DNA primase/helicase